MFNHKVGDGIRKFIMENFPLARQSDLGDNDELLGNGIIDSLGVLDLVAYLETNFGISIADTDLSPENFRTIKCLISFVEMKILSA